jgi:hypothetical protein
MRNWLIAASLGLAPLFFGSTARADDPALAAPPGGDSARAAAKLEWDALSAAVGALGKVVDQGDPSGRMTAANTEATKHTTNAFRALGAGDYAQALSEMGEGWGAISPVFDDFLDRSSANTAIELGAKTSAATTAWLTELDRRPATGDAQADIEAAQRLHADAARLRGSDPASGFEKEREALSKADDAFRAMASTGATPGT